MTLALALALLLAACGGTQSPTHVEIDEPVPVHEEHALAEGCTVDGWCRIEPDAFPAIARVWALAPDDVWVRSEDRQLLHWDGTRWWDVANTLADSEDHHRVGVVDFSGSPSTGVWGRSHNRLYRRAGDAWVHDATLADHTDLVSYVIGDVPTYIGDQGTCRYEGQWRCEWSHANPVVYRLGPLHGSAPDDLYGVQHQGNVHHWDGSAWTEVSNGMHELRAVFSPARDVVYAVGTNLGLLRNASGWGRVEALGAADNHVITGTGVDDVYVGGGASSIIQHFDGSEWTATTAGIGEIRSISAIEGFAVAGGPSGVSFFDGERWDPHRRRGGGLDYFCLRTTPNGLLMLSTNGTLRTLGEDAERTVELREPARCHDTGPVLAHNPVRLVRVDGTVEAIDGLVDVAGGRSATGAFSIASTARGSASCSPKVARVRSPSVTGRSGWSDVWCIAATVRRGPSSKERTRDSKTSWWLQMATSLPSVALSTPSAIESPTRSHR